MLLVARKNLFSERIRLVISVSGIALSVFLISLLLALFRGWTEKVGGFVEEADIDIWVAKEGTADFLSSASFLITKEGSDQLSSVPGLSSSVPPSIEGSFDPNSERWSPLIVRPMTATSDDTAMDVTLVGYEPAPESGLEAIGGPLRIKEGKSFPGPREVIIDEALSRRYGVRIDDVIGAAGLEWTVAGISSGGDFVAAQVIFITLREAQSALTMQGFTTYFVLELTDPTRRNERAAQLEEAEPGIVAITGEDFAKATRERVLGDVTPILLVVLALAFIVGLAVAGLTIYTATVEKSREFGILKAVGFTNAHLYRLVFEQSFVTSMLGFAVGMGLTLLATPFATDFVPQFVLLVRWQDVFIVAGATVLMALLAAYVPVQRMAAIDPTSVFRA